MGTKLKLAFLMDKHDTVGIDCVAMCVNDIICCGRQAAVFPGLYRLRQKYARERIAEIVAGVAEGCRAGRTAPSIGGETAEMPGFYPRGRIRSGRLLRGRGGPGEDHRRERSMQAGDAIIALPSTGVHSNGFSLVRKVFDMEQSAT